MSSPYAFAAEMINPKERRWARDPVAWASEKMGAELWSAQKEIMMSVRDNPLTAVQSCHEVGKCLYYKSMIPLADGRIVSANDLVGRYFAIQTFGDDGQQYPALAWASDNGIKPVLRVTTVGGRQIECTENHPLFAALKVGGGSGRRLRVDPIGWTDAEKLEIGTLLLVPEQLKIQGSRPADPDDVAFLGYMLGDGGTTQYVGFTQKNGIAKDDFTRIVQSWGCDIRQSGTYGLVVVGPEGERFGRKGENPVRNKIHEWGLFGKKAKEKSFPDWAWELPNDQLALLLNRLFACDGWACTRPGARGGMDAHIAISLSSEAMIRDVEMAMLRLGIVGKVRARSTGYDAKRFPSWEWKINRAEDLEKFRTLVGILGKDDAVNSAADAKMATGGRAAHWMRQNAPSGYRWDPVASIENLGNQPTVAISVPGTHTYLTTMVEHNSFIAGHVVCWWIDTHPIGEAFVVTSAPTDKQVKAILWREIGRAHRAGDLIGRTNLSEWYIGNELVAFGRKPADHDPTAFQGLHAKYMLLVWDEADGIPKAMWDAGSSLVANEHSRTLAIGNPDNPLSEFAAKCKPGSNWNTIHIGYERTPNFTGEDVSEDLKARLIHPKWVREKAEEWGVDSALFSSKCRGVFPEQNTDGFIKLDWLRRCRNLEIPEGTPVEAGVDVGAGGDRTVIRERRGMRVGREESFVDADPMRTVGKIVEKINEWGIERVKVDVIGIGWSLAGRLRELSKRHNGSSRETTHNAEVVGINFAEASVSPDRFINLRAEVYWTIGREYSRLGQWDLSSVDDEVFAELTAPSYTIMDSKGKIKIQAKDEIRSILGRSPDRADALLLAFAGGNWTAKLPSRSAMGTPLLGRSLG